MGIRTALISAGVCSCVWVAACGDDSTVGDDGAKPGVVFTSPSPGQLDVPLGTRIVVAFSDPVVTDALGACDASGNGGVCLVAPDGSVVAAQAEPAGSGSNTVEIVAPPLAPGTTYAVHVDAAIAPFATNLPDAGTPLFSFTTRASRPRAAAPTVVAIDGADPANLGSVRPLIESSTIHVLVSEPLATVTVEGAPGSVELVDPTTGADVPIRVLCDGIHIAIDPIDDLTAGTTYTLRLGSSITDVGGTPLVASAYQLTPVDSVGRGITKQTLRTWHDGDPGPAAPRAGAARNQIALDHPLIGHDVTTLGDSVLVSELGDPKALEGPIPFTIRRGSRLSASGLDIALGGQIPTGLSTGNVRIELATDGGGRLYRNPYQPPSQTPDNDRAPLYVDLVLDLDVYADDPEGNAVLGQTVLGVTATGTVNASDGVLQIETVGSMELGLLGVTVAPSNLVLELVTDASATPPTDSTPPTLLSAPGDDDLYQDVGAGVSLVFDEPIDLDRARAGGITLVDDSGATVPTTIEASGAAVVLRPHGELFYSTTYQVALSDVADVAGNAMAPQTLSFDTPLLYTTNVPAGLLHVHPGVPCALTGGNAGSPGRCAGGDGGDDLYHPFTLPANEDVSAAFDQPIIESTLTHFDQCNTGSVRIEQTDGTGTCTSAVPGTFVTRPQGFEFVPDVPWTVGQTYQLVIVSGGNKSCDAGEVCGLSGNAASFDPLNGNLDDGASGGPNVVIPFTGAPATGSTLLVAQTEPLTDINGTGFIEGSEVRRDANRAGLSILGTSGVLGDANFDDPDCVPELGGTQNCIYLAGSMPTELGELMTNCDLPDGTTAPACIPVTLDPEAVLGTSVGITASVIIDIDTDTDLSILRMREPAGGPIAGYIIDAGDGTAELVTVLDLYMDAPDMSVTLSDDDVHSKPLTLHLSGPVSFLPDGRIAIALANTLDVPITVNITAPLGIGGSVDLVMPAGQMKLQLVSPLVRGGEL